MPTPIEKRQGAKLPHWTAQGATYAVTFRLADSIPANAVDRLREQLEGLAALVERGVSTGLDEQVRLARLRGEAVDQLLHNGHGECILREPEAAKIVADALKHFDNARYRLVAWCVMPNHVHVVVTPLGKYTLAQILHSWKSFTAHAINERLSRTGSVWQSESYDHLIRDRADLMHHVLYTRENPKKAGLADWPWVG